MTAFDMDSPADAHPSDGVLLALHDGEMRDEEQRMRRHVETCAHCRARMDAIERDAAAVHRSLSMIPIPPLDAAVTRQEIAVRLNAGAPRTRSSRLAVVLLVAGAMAAAAATIPVRRWIAKRVDRPAAASVSVPPPSVAIPESSSAMISFGIAGPRLTVTFDSAPRDGTLSIERGDVRAVSVRTTSPAGVAAPAMVVLPKELVVRTTATSQSSYEITVPREVLGLKVVVAGRIIYDGAPAGRVSLIP